MMELRRQSPSATTGLERARLANAKFSRLHSSHVGLCVVRCLLVIHLASIFHGDVQGSSDCKEKVADVVFLLDSSFSIWQHHFQTQLSFLKGLINSFAIGPNHIRVGVVTYSTAVRLDVALNEHMSKHELLHAIGQIQYMGGGTRTGDAIRFAHMEMFTAEKGSRPWAAHMVILITDGYSYDNDQTAREASTARTKGMKLFAIGVGDGVDEAELRAIASPPDASHVFHVENYGALKHIQKLLATKACHQANRTDSSEHVTTDKDTPRDIATKRCEGKATSMYFLLDGSSSITQHQFQQQIRFLQQLVQRLDVGTDRTRLGVAVYSDHVHNVLSFEDHQQQSRHGVHSALHNSPYLTGSTNTGRALHFVRTHGFPPNRHDAARLILVLTDGQSTNRTHTLKEAQQARDEGIYVFAVGIGSQIDVDELMSMSSDPDENFVFHVDSFGGLKNIRDLLAIKMCGVVAPGYQSDQDSNAGYRVTKPTDILFIYDAAFVSRPESDVITDVIKYLVQTWESDPDTVRFGLLRENFSKGDNIDLVTGAKAPVLQAFLRKPHHSRLHTLLKKVRLHGYPTSNDDERSRAQKVIVLFAGSRMADSEAVEMEMKRLQFLQVRILVVAVDLAGENVDMLRGLNVAIVEVDGHKKLWESRQVVKDTLCQLIG